MLADMVETVGERLRRSREAVRPKLTQEALGKYIGVTRSAIAQCELGLTNSLTAENLIKAAMRLGKSPLWLATGEGLENDPGAFGEAVGALPEKDRLAVVEFVLYHMDRAGPLMGPKAGHYVTMIERIKTDLERKAGAPEKPAKPASTTKAKT